jgi:hypothetical protein
MQNLISQNLLTYKEAFHGNLDTYNSSLKAFDPAKCSAVLNSVSAASTSVRPLLRRGEKMWLSSSFTSRAISSWIAAAVFFLVAPAVPLSLDRAQMADILVDLDQIVAELLKTMEL